MPVVHDGWDQRGQLVLDVVLLRRSCGTRGIVRIRTSIARVHCQRHTADRVARKAFRLRILRHARITAEVFITTRFLTRPLDVASFSYQRDLSL